MSSKMKALFVDAHFSAVDKIKLAIKTCALPQIDPANELLVKVISSGVNPSDVLAVLGYFDHATLPRIPGRDFCGLVEAGPVDLIGKIIWGTGGASGIGFDGTQAEYLKIPVAAYAEIPNNVDPVLAGGLTLPYVTAYYALVKRACVKSGETCLITGALGQVGQAAMRIAYWKGLDPIALVRGEEQLAEAKKMGWNALDSLDKNLVLELSSITQKKKIDVIFNSIGSLVWDDYLACLGEFGRIVVIGAREGFREVSLNLFKLYRANQDIIGINSVSLDFCENAELLNELKAGFESGDLSSLSEGQYALYSMESAQVAYQNVMSTAKPKKRHIVCFS